MFFILISLVWMLKCKVYILPLFCSWKYKKILLKSVQVMVPYLSDIFISGKNVVFSTQKWQHFCQIWKYLKNMQVDHNLNGLWNVEDFYKIMQIFSNVLMAQLPQKYKIHFSLWSTLNSYLCLQARIVSFEPFWCTFGTKENFNNTKSG